jgi:hypothetical protein
MRFALLAAGLLLASQALAETEISLAHVDEVDGETSEGFIVGWTKPWRKIGPFDVDWEVVVGGIEERTRIQRADTDRVFFVGGGVRQNYKHFFISSNVAFVSSENSILTSRHQFITGIGYARGHFVIAIRHISNANTGGDNQGENLLSIGYRW